MPAALVRFWLTPSHSMELPALLPTGACDLGTDRRTLQPAWWALPAGLQVQEPVWRMVLLEASTSSCMGGLAHRHIGRLLARWLSCVPGKLLVAVMSSQEHGHQVAGEQHIAEGA